MKFEELVKTFVETQNTLQFIAIQSVNQSLVIRN